MSRALLKSSIVKNYASTCQIPDEVDQRQNVGVRACVNERNKNVLFITFYCNLFYCMCVCPCVFCAINSLFVCILTCVSPFVTVHSGVLLLGIKEYIAAQYQRFRYYFLQGVAVQVLPDNSV